jgi:hypothetical protein
VDGGGKGPKRWTRKVHAERITWGQVKTLRRRGSIWSVGRERDDEKIKSELLDKSETDEKSARKENLRFPIRGQVRTKRRCGDEAQSGSLVGKETTKKRER